MNRANLIVARLRTAYPDAASSLDFTTPLELLVATILSAQCTDERVNRTTPALFGRYRTAADFAAAEPDELEALVRPTGFFKVKAAHIRAACSQIVTEHGGAVPTELDALTALPGVGRKTANVLRGVAFGLPGLAVDTHVKRLSGRLGLTGSADPEQIERDLSKQIDPTEWTALGHRMQAHGRAVCTARRPRCGACVLADLCPSFNAENP